jgi:hypothetical protein
VVNRIAKKAGIDNSAADGAKPELTADTLFKKAGE